MSKLGKFEGGGIGYVRGGMGGGYLKPSQNISIHLALEDEPTTYNFCQNLGYLFLLEPFLA
jgi:hypothetical protein